MTEELKHRNEVKLAGVLARDPELHKTTSGKMVTNFTVTTTCGTFTEFHRCTAWERQAEKLIERFRKGSYVEVTGRLQTRSWDDKQTGQKKYATEVVAWGISDGSKDAEQTQPPITPNIHGVPITDDDIPF